MDVRWIKLTTDMFDNRKIKHLRKLPDGNNIVLIWVMLLTMAGRCNAGGMIFLTENIPYTPKMLADELGFEENTVQLALQALAQLNMIVMAGEYYCIAGWEEHQNAEKLEKIREQNRLRKASQRARERLLPHTERDTSVTVTECHATEEDKEEDKDIDIDKDIRRERHDCQQIADLYNSICKSFPSIRSLSEARKKAIRARLKAYSVEDFKKLFENAEASDFLKGANDRNWTASFDWLIKDSNMAKVLDGNYENKPKSGRKEIVPKWMDKEKLGSGRGEAATPEDMERMKRMIKSLGGDDEELAARAEKLRNSLRGS